MKQIFERLKGSADNAAVRETAIHAADEKTAATLVEVEKRTKPVTTKDLVLDIDGEDRKFTIRRYPATHGMEVVRLIEQSIDHVNSARALGRRLDKDGLIAVFYGVTAHVGGQEYRLDSEAAIDAYTAHWKNIVTLRDEALAFNMIDEPSMIEERSRRVWAAAGSELAAGFMGFATKALEQQGIYVDPRKAAK